MGIKRNPTIVCLGIGDDGGEHLRTEAAHLQRYGVELRKVNLAAIDAAMDAAQIAEMRGIEFLGPDRGCAVRIGVAF